MVNDNPGYDYSTLADINTDELSLTQTRLIVDELKKLSGVKGVTGSYAYLPEMQSGDNIFLPGDDHEYMNVADLFDVGDDYFNVMGIPVIAGRTFTEHTDTMREAMVSRKFEERMKQLAGWDHAVGKQVICTSYNGPYTIVGVYDDPRIGSITNPDHRPSICFYSQTHKSTRHITVRFHDMDALDAANKRLHELIPENPDVTLRPYTLLMTQLYTDAHRFRSTVMIGGLVALIIALIGLIGYLAGEMARRQKEIAIRKVNGAHIIDVLQLFSRDVLRLALPAVVVGAVGGWYVSRLWLEQFSEKAVLSPVLYGLCALAVVVVILTVVCVGCYRVASSNPVDYLKNE
jgi:putative ABC transport system permease protein